MFGCAHRAWGVDEKIAIFIYNCSHKVHECLGGIMYILIIFLIMIILLMLEAFNKPVKFLLLGLMIYYFSFLTLWSIGIYLLIFSIFFLQLAIAYTFNLARNNYYVMLLFGISLLIWLVCILNIDDYWIFWPLFNFYEN